MPRAGLALGRFVARPSPLHRLDAGAKLVAAMLLASGSVWSQDTVAQAGLAGLVLAGFAVARLPWRIPLRALRGAVWLLAFVALANLGWGVVAGRMPWAAEMRADTLAVLLLRVLTLVLLGVLFTSTTVPVDVARGLGRLLGPLARLRLPVHELGMLLVLALSFVPVFFDAARALAAAHRVKVGHARWGLRQRWGAAIPLLVPLFVGVLRRADELAIAMDARCFVPGRPRSAYVPGRLGPAEIGCLALCLLVLLACLWL